MPPSWKIYYYVSEDTTCPFEEFIGKLKTRQERADCVALIRLLKRGGDTLDGHRHLTYPNGLREIRDRSMRLFYVCCGDDRIVIMGGLLPAQGKEFFDDIYRKAEDHVCDD